MGEGRARMFRKPRRRDGSRRAHHPSTWVELSPVAQYTIYWRKESFSYLWNPLRIGVRRRGVCGYGAEGRARNRSDDIASERRGNAPPNCPGQHCNSGSRRRGGGGMGEVVVDCERVEQKSCAQELRQLSRIHSTPSLTLPTTSALVNNSPSPCFLIEVSRRQVFCMSFHNLISY